MKIKALESVKGIISIKKKNVKTGKVQNYPEMHNLITNNYKRLLLQSTSSSTTIASYVLYVGTGSTAPSASDTQLTNRLSWPASNNIGFTAIARRLKIISKSQVEYTLIFSIPASDAYVANLTEVGLYSRHYVWKKVNNYWQMQEAGLVTHSLFKDAENNPYVIEKTALDQLEIEYKLVFSTASLISLASLFWFGQAGYMNYQKPVLLPHTYHGVIGCIGSDMRQGVLTALRKYAKFTKIDNAIYVWYEPSSVNGCFNPVFYDPIYQTSDNSNTEGISVGPAEVLNDQGVLTTPNRRIPVKWSKNGHYILGFGLNGMAWDGDYASQVCPIFDMAVFNFTEQNLEDYSIGVGDGVTTEFKPPLEHWIPETEKIYVDGVQLTRNVDYTCDPYNNINNLAEFLPLYHATVIDADWRIGTTYSSAYGASGHPDLDTSDLVAGDAIIANGHVNYREIYLTAQMNKTDYSYTTEKNYEDIRPYIRPAKIPDTLYDETAKDLSKYVYAAFGGISTKKGLVFELPINELNIPWEVDTVYLYFNNSTSAVTFSVSYSDDLETWTKVCDHVTGYKSGRPNAYNLNQVPLSQWCEYSILAVTKPYWKLEMHYNPSTTPTNYARFDNEIGLIIKHKGNNIVFTNPPADGAVITMDAKTDIIYKDEKNVIDVGAAFSI